MKTTITKTTLVEINIATIQVDTKVRYWEDATINGERDIDFYEAKGEGEPKMPCAVKIKETPRENIYSDHWRWKPTIDVDSGRITNWTIGTEARVHYKVCDEFSCTLLNDGGKEILVYEDYVPSFMYPQEDGYGDYIIMDINKDGYIKNWDTKRVESFVKEEFRYS